MSTLRGLAVVVGCTLPFVAGTFARGTPPERKDATELAQSVDAYLAPLADTGLFSGSVLLAKGGVVLVDRAYGEADIAKDVANTPDTRFKLMSVTKSVTAVAVLRLVQASKLALDDPVGRHLPSWPPAWGAVTVRHLLDHTSGIANLELEWVTALGTDGELGLRVWKRLAPKVAGRALDGAPGSRHAYSNFNYVLLGLVAEAAAKRPFPELVRAEVLAPAGMADTGFDDGDAKPRLALGYFRGRDGAPEPRGQDMSVIQAAGGLYSTTRDLYRFDRALRGDALLSAALRERMLTPAANTYDYALGWQVREVQGRPCVRHSGGANGYVADLLRFPEDDACVVVLSNFAFAPSMVIAEDLAGLLLGRDVDTPARVPRGALDRCAGVYRGTSSTIAVRRSGDALVSYEVPAGATRAGATLLVALGDDRFRRQAWPTLLRFAEGGGGRELRMAGPQPTVLTRVADPGAAWQSAAGRYRDDAGDGSTYRIRRDGGRLELRLPAGWGADLEIVPLSEDAALTLYGEDFGTVVSLQRDPAGGTAGLRWTRNDGRVLELVRAGD